MDDQELYRQKHEAQLEEWEAELEKLKAKASKASADAQLELSEQIARLEEQVNQGKEMLSELADAGEEAFKSVKKRVDDAWTSLEAGFEEARERSAGSEEPAGPH